ncbi:MAG: hypothetical protein MHM6MM_001762 [Cercozoa sp. M6MM]
MSFAATTQLIGVIGDKDIVAGLLLTGIGQRDRNGNTSWFTVESSTTDEQLEQAFRQLSSRSDIGILLVTFPVADRIRHLIDAFEATTPVVLEIPSKDAKYDPSADPVFQRVRALLGK